MRTITCAGHAPFPAHAGPARGGPGQFQASPLRCSVAVRLHLHLCTSMESRLAALCRETWLTGHAANAIPLPSCYKCTLDSMIHKWAQQGADARWCGLHASSACWSAPRCQANGVAALQLLQPEVSFPIFVGSNLRTTSRRCRWRACVVHLGSSMFLGHYQVMLASPGYQWHIKDDHAPARRCSIC